MDGVCPSLPATHRTHAFFGLSILHQPGSAQLGRQDHVPLRWRRAFHHRWTVLDPARDPEQDQRGYRCDVCCQDTRKEVQPIRGR